MAAVERLPRAWRDETYYEELRADAPTIAKAAAAVAIAACVVAAPAAARVVLSGKFIEGFQTLVGAGGVALAVWAVFATVASLVAQFVFRRRHRWGPTFAGLGFALSPLALLVLAFVPVLGILVTLVAGSWSLALCYFAIRGTVQTDEVQTLGITVSVLLAGVVLWMVSQFAFGPRVPAEIATCDGLVDVSGVCTPMAELSPSIQTAIAVPPR